MIISCASVGLRVEIFLASQRYRDVPSEEGLVHSVSLEHTSAMVQGGHDVKHIIPWTSLSLQDQIFAHQILAY